MPIKDLSNLRRFPRAGIIRLGVRVPVKGNPPCKCEKSERKKCFLCMGTGIIHRPKEVDHFVCPSVVQKKFGKEPKKLKVLIPVEDEEVFFRQYYYCYGNGVILCRGDGEKATFFNFDIGDYDVKDCPCDKLEQKKCDKAAILQFLLPDIEKPIGVWQITTHSRNSIIDINSGISFVRGIAGRIKFIPLWLTREEITTSKLDKNGVVRGQHWTMKFSLAEMGYKELQEYGQQSTEEYFLPAPINTIAEDDSPECGNGDKIIDMKAQEEINESKKPTENEASQPELDDKESLRLDADLKVVIEKYEELYEVTVSDKQFKNLKTKKDFEKTIDFYKSKVNEKQPGLFS